MATSSGLSVLARNRDRDPAPASPAERPAGRLAVLDGLRLVAALMVVAIHYTAMQSGAWGAPTSQVFSRLQYVTVYGRLGVELFFLISGFVICMSAWGRSLGAFFTSRVTRLYPAYWFAVLAVAITANVFGLPNFGPTVSFRTLVVNLTMLQGPLGVPLMEDVFWTLGLELHFYLLFAVVLWRGLTYRRVVLFCALWLTVAVLIPGSAPPSFTSALPVLDTLIDANHAPFFVAGVVLYLMRRFRPTILLWGMLGVCYALAIRQAEPITAQQIGGGQAMRWLGSCIVMTGIFMIMIAVALGWLDWVRGGWLTVAGALSYPLYLLHYRIGLVAIAELHGRISKWPLLIGLILVMLVASWLVHRLVERPLARRLKRTLTAAMAETSVDQQSGRDGVSVVRSDAQALTVSGRP